ncbi:MAG: chemotaxis protein CheW [Chitinophagaceae bacterium]|nr:chemotaxis protein CheW [Oligoflexus sp.]
MTQRPQIQRFLSFSLDNHLFAFPVAIVREITLRSDVNLSSDRLAHHVKVRDEEWPLVDLRRTFGLLSKSADIDSRIILIEAETGCTGILVDSIDRVIARRPFPALFAADHSSVFSTLEMNSAQDDFVLLLDIKACLAAPAADAIHDYRVNTASSRAKVS